MIIQANDYKSETIAELILEIEIDLKNKDLRLNADLIETAATHIIMTDTDWDSEDFKNEN